MTDLAEGKTNIHSRCKEKSDAAKLRFPTKKIQT